MISAGALATHTFRTGRSDGALDGRPNAPSDGAIDTLFNKMQKYK